MYKWFMVLPIILLLGCYEPTVDNRVFKYEEGQIVQTVIGKNRVMIISVDTFRCFGGACDPVSLWPKRYTVRMPDGTTSNFEEYELENL